MVFKRCLDNSSNKSVKRSKSNSNSKVFLKSNENKPELIDLTDEQDQVNEKRQLELVIDLTAEHEDQIIELDRSLDLTVHDGQKKNSKESLKISDKKPELIIDLTEDEDNTFDSMVQATVNTLQ